MRTIDAIKNILIEQTNAYYMLLNLLQRERVCLVNLNVGGIEELSKEKDTVVLRLRLLEEERIRLTNKFFADNMIEGPVNLHRLYEVTADESFYQLRSQLTSLFQSIEEVNAFNTILIGRSLNFIKNSVSFLESFGFSINQNSTGVILSKEI
ncbi:MAG: flagellar export chaperone FlgN [Nitrospirota bacterium]